MKLLTASSALLLLASTVVAAPPRPDAATHKSSRSRLQRAAARRSPAQHAGQAHAAAASPSADDDDDDNTHVYETNWAGAVIETTGVQSVTGTFTVPVPSTDGSGAGWVGIDGNDCYTGILQTGVNWYRDGANVTYVAWYEWFPASMEYWTGFAVDGGDVIRATVTADGTRSGVALVENLTKGTNISHAFTSSETLSPLCQTDAEWIVEDYVEDLAFVEFADFGTFTFTDASVVTAAGTTGLADAEIFDIEQSSVIRTNSSILSDSSVAVSWIK